MIDFKANFRFNFFEKITPLFIILYYGSVVVISGGEINFFNKALFPFYILFLLFYLISNYFYENLSSKDLRKFLILFWLGVIYFNYSVLINYSDFNINWFFGDFAVIICLILSIFIGKKIKVYENIHNYFDFIVSIIFSLLLFDFIFNYNPESGQLRMYSRLIFVPCYFLYRYFSSQKNLYLYLFLGCLFLSIFANMRYGFIITIFFFFIYLFLFSKDVFIKAFKRKYILALIFLFIIIFSFFTENVFFARWRVLDLFSIDINTSQLGLIASLSSRYFEVADTISHIKNTLNPFTIFFGNGSGAAFKADLYWIWAGNDYYDVSKSFTSQSHKHIIHFGPLRFFFRYGLLGLIIVGVFLMDVIKFIKNNYQSNNLNFAIAITLFALSLRFFIQPIFNDIMISILIISFYSLQRKDNKNSNLFEKI